MNKYGVSGWASLVIVYEIQAKVIEIDIYLLKPNVAFLRAD